VGTFGGGGGRDAYGRCDEREGGDDDPEHGNLS
jgi:hypothetical protein